METPEQKPLTPEKALGLGAIIGLILGFGIAVALFAESPVEPVDDTRIVYVQRPAPPPLAAAPLAEIRTLYLRRVDTVEVRIPVPMDFEQVGVIGREPLRVTGRSVHLRYWSPDSLRFIDDTYRIRQRHFGGWISADAGFRIPGYAFIGLSANARWKRIGASLGGAYTIRGPEVRLALGWRLLGVH